MAAANKKKAINQVIVRFARKILIVFLNLFLFIASIALAMGESEKDRELTVLSSREVEC